MKDKEIRGIENKSVVNRHKRIPLVLGSASPRRKKILEKLIRDFSVMTAETEEIHDASDPVRTVTQNALAKYRACRRLTHEAAIITADTLVWFKGKLIGKPENIEEAASFLNAFSSSSHIVFSGIALGMPGEKEPDLRVEASSVHFRELSGKLIDDYLKQTKPLDRAGAYDIDENGELLIEDYSGSYTNIMGLPAEVIRDWLAACRISGHLRHPPVI
ncbi:MAG: Maf family protein [Kiritimatiellia bacterium]